MTRFDPRTRRSASMPAREWMRTLACLDLARATPTYANPGRACCKKPPGFVCLTVAGCADAGACSQCL
jgi:hypothetical protein